jgi:hypothetical protein
VLHHGHTPLGSRDHHWFSLRFVRLGLPKANCFLNSFSVHLLTYLSFIGARRACRINARNAWPDARNVDPLRYTK